MVAPVAGSSDDAADVTASPGSRAPALLTNSYALWLAAVLLYGVGDTATTLAGFGADHITEAGPVVGGFVAHSGVGGLFVVKLLTFAGFYLAWRVLPPPGRAGIPLALSIVGACVTVWNLLVLLPPGTLR